MASGSTSNAPSPVSGISLIIDDGENASQTLNFQKADTRVINIGRKSGQAKEAFAAESDKALFKCPVISRKHAKITFTEYGNVYITDLRSHHGTHLLKPGDAVSKMITPEVPNFLSDGDVITFGKTVGKEQSLVRPVSVRVKLHHAPSSVPAPTPAPPVHDVTVISDSSDESPSPKPSSGRYGIFLPSSSPSSSSDSESDMEMSPPPPPDKPPKRLACGSDSRLLPPSRILASYIGSSQSHPLPRIISALSPPMTPQRSWEEEPESEIDLEDGRSVIGNPSFSPVSATSIGDILHPFVGPWPVAPFDPTLFDMHRFAHRMHPCNSTFGPPMMGGFGLDEMRQFPMPGPQIPQPVVSGNPNADIPAGLDDERPVPAKAAVLPDPSVDVISPDIHPNEGEVVSRPQTDHTRLPNMPIVVSIPSIEDDQDEEEDNPTPTTEEGSHDNSCDTPTDEARSAGPVIDGLETAEQISKLDLTALDETHAQEHLSVIATSEEICTEIEPSRNETIADPTMEGKSTRQRPVRSIENNHSFGGGGALLALLALRTRIEEEIVAFGSARSKVEELVSELDARIQATSSSPLKRKRDDVDGIDEEEQAPATTPVQVVSFHGTPGSGVPAPKRRRTMRVISAVAKTTAIATIGAVAAWSALAYA